jgi:hypothetical protein
MNRFLLSDFTIYKKDKIGPLATGCCTKLTGNAYFKDAGDYVKAIQAAVDDYLPAAAIKNPIPEQTALLAQYRRVLNAALTAFAKYANDLYPTDEAALLSTGLDLSKERERHTTLDPPSKCSLSDGTEDDTVCARFVRTPHAVATEIRYTDDPSRPREEWRSVVTTKSSVLLRGYKRKTEVYAMFRSVGGDTDDQEFSDVISRIVQ